jgi:AcrR family transcriptional regulator
MPRPSRNIDQLLIQAALELLPQTGVRALSIRRVAEHAGVNLGMFHYHFKTKDVFIATVLQQLYDGMFANLELESHRSILPVENLRAAMLVLAYFARDQRQLLVRLLGDGFSGEAAAVEFLKANLPRHVGVIATLIMQCQQAGVLRQVAVPQAFAFLAGAVMAPIFIGTAALSAKLLPQTLAKGHVNAVFSDAAIVERIDMAIAGLSLPSANPVMARHKTSVTNPSKKGGAKK